MTRRFLVALVLSLPLAFAAAAPAATVTVDQTCSSPVGCQCPSGAYTDIGCAVAAAFPGDTVHIWGPGTYVEHGVDVDKGLTFLGQTTVGQPFPVIDGQFADVIFNINTHGAVTFENLTLINGNAPLVPGPFDPNAGAISTPQGALLGPLTVRNCVFDNNAGSAGAIHVAGTLVVEDSQFIGNFSTRGAIEAFGTTHVHNAIFQWNHADVDGGALTFHGWPLGSSLFVTESIFTDNVSYLGAGAVEIIGGPYASIDLSGFTHNVGEYGGAVRIASLTGGVPPPVDITRSYFGNNTAYQDGGAIMLNYPDNKLPSETDFVDGDSCTPVTSAPSHRLSLSETDLAKNVAAGRGAAVFGGTGVALEIFDVAVDDHQGDALFLQEGTILVGRSLAVRHASGTALVADHSSVDLTSALLADGDSAIRGAETCFGLEHVTAAGHDTALAHDSSSVANLKSSVIAYNQLDCGGPTRSLDHNLDSDGTCQLVEPNDLAQVVAPWLEPDYRPKPGSPVIDSADPACGGFTNIYDARGAPHARQVGATCDRGGLERQSFACVPDGKVGPNEQCDPLVPGSCAGGDICQPKTCLCTPG